MRTHVAAAAAVLVVVVVVVVAKVTELTRLLETERLARQSAEALCEKLFNEMASGTQRYILLLQQAPPQLYLL